MWPLYVFVAADKTTLFINRGISVEYAVDLLAKILWGIIQNATLVAVQIDELCIGNCDVCAV